MTMKRAATIVLLCGGTGTLPALSSAAHPTTTSGNSNRRISSNNDNQRGRRNVISSPSELPFDPNGRLSSHVLLYPDGGGGCSALIESIYATSSYGFESRAVTGEAEAVFFDEGRGGDAGGSSSLPRAASEDHCRAVCLERGVDRSLVAASVAPSRRYVYDGDGDGEALASSFSDWFRDHCRRVEVCFMNNHGERPPLIFHSIDAKTGERKRRGQLEYGGGKDVACLNSYPGRRYEFTDPGTGEVLLSHTVEFTAMVYIGETPSPVAVGGAGSGNRNFTADVEYALRREWTRHLRVKRTFSALGFRKGRLPDDLFGGMGAFYYNNRHRAVRENFAGKGPHINWWEAEISFVQVPLGLKATWQTRLREMVEEWAGVKMEQTDMYGLRRYGEGARLISHVDRERTHAASLIVNVDQGNVAGGAFGGGGWPVEIHDHADRLHQITMEPGDVVYYESAKCLHGRNVPLAGRGAYYVNLFTHYRPAGEGDAWFERANPAGTPEPLIDVGECRLSEEEEEEEETAGTASSRTSEGRRRRGGRAVVRCDDDSIGQYLSPTLFRATSGEDLIRWWRSSGGGAAAAALLPDLARPDDGNDEL